MPANVAADRGARARDGWRELDPRPLTLLRASHPLDLRLSTPVRRILHFDPAALSSSIAARVLLCNHPLETQLAHAREERLGHRRVEGRPRSQAQSRDERLSNCQPHVRSRTTVCLEDTRCVTLLVAFGFPRGVVIEGSYESAAPRGVSFDGSAPTSFARLPGRSTSDHTYRRAKRTKGGGQYSRVYAAE